MMGKEKGSQSFAWERVLRTYSFSFMTPIHFRYLTECVSRDLSDKNGRIIAQETL